ncbi:hypothetical protein ACFVIM_33330 [Streptomyces sp. NPDC057638]|uniref:hypothetical protein n=1 Tax=Streptomyces sp. NPDC057638 TaxID=3346190 RepID=UPI0036CCB982
MTVCEISPPPTGYPTPHPTTTPRGFTISANGAYAARLAGTADALFPERWTLEGPEPLAVPLPLGQPEEPGTQVLPLTDGRVLIGRRVAGRYHFSLIQHSGTTTVELPLGGIESAELRLLPPSPRGLRAFALVPGERVSSVWLVAGGSFGPEHVADVPGHCSGGVWLDRTGRMLALDRRLGDGPVKAVAVDLERGGEVTPLLQIAADSSDRLLLAAPDCGLLLIRSDAPGEERLGWGVLGGDQPVRFPECLRLPDARLTPFALQRGGGRGAEECGVALRIDGPTGLEAPQGEAWGDPQGAARGGDTAQTQGLGGGASPTQASAWGGGTSQTQAWGGGTSQTQVWGGGTAQTQVWGGGTAQTQVWGGGTSQTQVWGGGTSQTQVWGGGTSQTQVWGRVGLWRPSSRRLLQQPAPAGWLTGTGLWSDEGTLRLLCATEAGAGRGTLNMGASGCGVARLDTAADFGPVTPAPTPAPTPTEPVQPPTPPNPPAPTRPISLQQAARMGRMGLR